MLIIHSALVWYLSCVLSWQWSQIWWPGYRLEIWTPIATTNTSTKARIITPNIFE